LKRVEADIANMKERLNELKPNSELVRGMRAARVTGGRKWIEHIRKRMIKIQVPRQKMNYTRKRALK
jgi:hypothetical protein